MHESATSYIAVYCSVLQRALVCCSVLQCAAMSCSVLQSIAVYHSVLQCFAASYSIERVTSCWLLAQLCTCMSGWMRRNLCQGKFVAVCCNVLQCVVVCCSVL